MSLFQLWLKWCVRLQQADEAWDRNKDGPNRKDYACARRYAERRCDEIEEKLTS